MGNTFTLANLAEPIFAHSHVYYTETMPKFSFSMLSMNKVEVPPQNQLAIGGVT